MFLKFIRETSLNTMRIFFHGRPIEGFVKKVISDPFKARSDVRLQEQYEFYRKNKHLLLLNKSQRIVLNFILLRDFETMVNELPHFFLLTIKHNCPVYSLPSFSGMNPVDLKSGDFVVSNLGVCVESKSYAFLRLEKINSIKLQYGLNTTNSTLLLNIFFGLVESDLIKSNYMSALEELNFQPFNINLISIADLQLLHTEQNIFKFFNMYNISWFIYKDKQYDCITLQLQQIINCSRDHNAVTLSKKYLEIIENERKNIFSTRGRKKSKLKFVEDFNLNQVDLTYYDNLSDLETPEDFISDVGDWFSED